jgi:tetratricopeptide (TPR) repeat protein
VIHYRRPYGDLDVPLSSVQKALGLTDDELRRRDFNRLLLRGALLHADIAILRPAEQTFRPPLTPGQAAAVRVEVRDGRQEAIRPPSPHWDVGRDLLDAVTPRPSADPVVLLWYQATAAWLESEHSLAEAGQQLDHGIQLFPSDAALRFDRGWLYEFLAAPRVQSAVLALSLPRNVRVNVGSSRADLERAEEDFRKALEADPAFTEATVRLARVRALLGRHAEAIADLQEPARTARPALQYLANLFLGDAQQALGQRAAARQAYERAASLFPRAQSPLLALSRLAWLSGDRTGGVRAGRRVLGLETLDDFDDPWWQYFSPQGIDADRLLGELRAAITRGEKQ